jgi:hypothetical protein
MANQRTILTLAVASLIIIGLAVFLLLRVIGGGSSNDSAHDADLKHTADRLLPILNKPGGKFPIRDASLPSFQAWVYNVQPIFVKETGGEKGQRFEQVLFSDPTTMPPQGVMVNRPTKAERSFECTSRGSALQACYSRQGRALCWRFFSRNSTMATQERSRFSCRK